MKTRWKPGFTGSFIGLVLLIGFPVIAVAGKLNADEVEQLIKGNTLVFEVHAHGEGGRKQTRYYAPNGIFRQLNKKGNKTKKGNWSINDEGQLCNSLKGTGACHVIYKRGKVWETYVEASNPMAGDKHILTITKVLEGNPNGL